MDYESAAGVAYLIESTNVLQSIPVRNHRVNHPSAQEDSGLYRTTGPTDTSLFVIERHLPRCFAKRLNLTTAAGVSRPGLRFRGR